MKFKNGQTILFTGDSITDCERARPVGVHLGLGTGYVSFLNALVAVRHPELQLEVLNTGVSGNRITDLEARWDDDVLAVGPDWLSVMIGINDVWRHFSRPLMQQVELPLFEGTYRSLLDRTRPAIPNLILGTPYFIEKNPEDPMRRMMGEYGAVVKQLAVEYDAVLVDTQAAFDRMLAYRACQSLSGDRIHPNYTGHMVLTEAFYAAIAG